MKTLTRFKMKHLTITTALLLLFSSNGNAQSKKFSLGIHLFPNYSAGIISNDGNTPGEVQSGFDAIETWKPSLNSNAFVEYQLTEKSLLGFGLGYHNNGEKTQKLALSFNIDPITGQPIIDPAAPAYAKFVYNRHHVEVPLYYKRMFGLRFYVQAGISGMINIFNTKTSIKYFNDGTKDRNTSADQSTDFRRFNLAANLGCGWNYLNRENYTLYVQPMVQYGIFGVSKSASLNRNFFSLGISTGIKL
jgi:hypothetical protein